MHLIGINFFLFGISNLPHGVEAGHIKMISIVLTFWRQPLKNLKNFG